MTMTIWRTALSLAAAGLMLAAPMAPPVFAGPAVVNTIQVGNDPFSVAFSPNGKLAYVANYDGQSLSVM
jgi:hypothetical protein